MMEQKRGRIVLVRSASITRHLRVSPVPCDCSSAVAFGGMVGYSPYAPSKFALRGLADCLRNELQVAMLAM